jgi:hypothetical protein
VLLALMRLTAPALLVIVASVTSSCESDRAPQAASLPRVRVTQRLCVRGDQVPLWRFA